MTRRDQYFDFVLALPFVLVPVVLAALREAGRRVLPLAMRECRHRLADIILARMYLRRHTDTHERMTPSSARLPPARAAIALGESDRSDMQQRKHLCRLILRNPQNGSPFHAWENMQQFRMVHRERPAVGHVNHERLKWLSVKSAPEFIGVHMEILTSPVEQREIDFIASCRL
jgi:hypothetical protein